jgi:hypothetical protein
MLSGTTGTKNFFAPLFLVLLFMLASCDTPEVAPGPTENATNTEASMGAEAGWMTVTVPALDLFSFNNLSPVSCLGENILVSGTYTYRIKVNPTPDGYYMVVIQFNDKQDGLILTGEETGTIYSIRSSGFLQGKFLSLENQIPISVRHEEKFWVTNPQTGATAVLSHSLRLLPNSKGEVKVFLDVIDLTCQPRQSKNK